MRIGHFDCFAGVAGDMWVGAMLDAGLPLAPLQDAVASLGLPGVAVRADPVHRGGMASTWFRVDIDSGRPARPRHLADLMELLAGGRLPATTVERAGQVLRALAEAEARVHGQAIDEVHFHEVGAEDTVVDVACACLGVELLGLERVYASAVTVGTGTVECEHGILPVPAPGALECLRGIPLRQGGPDMECVTPTGAALLRTLVDEFEPTATWTPTAIGYGAGSRDPDGHPNLLRLTLADERGRPTGGLWEIACTLDTATGEQLGWLIDALLARGAADAFVTSVHMKKGRPGQMVTVLADDRRRPDILRLLLEESSSLGVRQHRVERDVLPRWEETVPTPWGPVRCKMARLPSGAVVRRPEDDEVTRLAQELSVGRREVLARLAAALDRHGSE